MRSTRPPRPAVLHQCAAASTWVELADGESGVAPGQACVLYSDDGDEARVFGGGFIERSERGAEAEAMLSRLAPMPRTAPRNIAGRVTAAALDLTVVIDQALRQSWTDGAGRQDLQHVDRLLAAGARRLARVSMQWRKCSQLARQRHALARPAHRTARWR